jgi:hypothetical protein
MQYLFVISVEIGRLNNSAHKAKSRDERLYFNGTSSSWAS